MLKRAVLVKEAEPGDAHTRGACDLLQHEVQGQLAGGIDTTGSGRGRFGKIAQAGIVLEACSRRYEPLAAKAL